MHTSTLWDILYTGYCIDSMQSNNWYILSHLQQDGVLCWGQHQAANLLPAEWEGPKHVWRHGQGAHQREPVGTREPLQELEWHAADTSWVGAQIVGQVWDMTDDTAIHVVLRTQRVLV